MNNFPKITTVDLLNVTTPWEGIIEILLMVILYSFFLERALALFFESNVYLNLHKRLEISGHGNHKATVSGVIAIWMAYLYKVDVLAILSKSDQASLFGILVTGLIIAGGSKASIKLFRDVLKIRSSAYDAYKQQKEFDKIAKTPPQDKITNPLAQGNCCQ